MIKLLLLVLMFFSCVKPQDKFDIAKTVVYYYPENIETYNRKGTEDIIKSIKTTKFYPNDISSPLFYNTMDSLLNHNSYKKHKSKGFEPDFVIKLNSENEDIYISLDYFGDFKISTIQMEDSVFVTNGYLVDILELYVKNLKQVREKYKH